MFPRVVQAYQEQGLRLDLGNPSKLFSSIVDPSTGSRASTGAGFSITDAMLFTAISQVHTPDAVFIIGNAFGISTFVLADLFPQAKIDVIDAETDGADNVRGSEVTRKIASVRYPNVRLTTGFSPRDIRKAARFQKYQLAFVDGLHTNEQMIADFQGIQPLLDSTAVVVFHDVALSKMFKGWDVLIRLTAPEGFKGYKMAFTQFGTCVLSRGSEAVDKYLSSVAGDFNRHRYHIGVPPFMETRPRFWTCSFYEYELLVRRTFSRLFRRG